MAFATSDDLQTLLGRTFDDAERSQADLVVALASAAVRAETGQTWARVTNDVAHLHGTWARELDLPERPVVDVTAVAINGVPQPLSAWSWNGLHTLRRGYPFTTAADVAILADEPDRTATGIPQAGATGPAGLHWGGPDTLITVTYSHGVDLADLPGELRLVTLMVAKRTMVNADGVASEFLGPYQVQYGQTAAGFELTDGERRILRPWRRRAHRSIG